MRKRRKLLSLATALALCVSYMVPAAALADLGGAVVDQGAGADAQHTQAAPLTGNESETPTEQPVAKVTLTTSDGLTWSQDYSNLLEAFDAARLGKIVFEDGSYQYANTSVVELLNSNQTYTLESEDKYPISFEYSQNVVVDLNGCTLKRSVDDNQKGIMKVVDSANVTFKNGTLDFEVSCYNYPSAIKLSTSGGNPALTLESMSVKVTGTEKDTGGAYGGYAIFAEGGTLNIKSGAWGD